MRTMLVLAGNQHLRWGALTHANLLAEVHRVHEHDIVSLEQLWNCQELKCSIAIAP